MFWDDKNDSEGWQIFKNASFLKMPVTNKTRDEIMPVFVTVMIILVVVILIGACIKTL